MDGVFESGAGRRAERILAKGVVVGWVVGLLIVAGTVLATLRLAAADQAYWQVSGPPCPSAAQAELDRIGRPLAQVSDVGGARFVRISGTVYCNELTNVLGLVEATACQFNRPRALAVWSKGGSALFQFPGGQSATVTVSDNHPPRCVIAVHHDGD